MTSSHSDKPVREQTLHLAVERKIEWLGQRGAVVPIPRSNDGFPQACSFESQEGIEAKFFFSDGEIVFVGDNTTFR